jgi:hypothetical protein
MNDNRSRNLQSATCNLQSPISDLQSAIRTRHLWNTALSLISLALVAALALIIALALGWNSPRPNRPPDWEASGLPRRLVASPGRTAVALLGYPGNDLTLEVEALPLAGPDFNGYGLVYRAQDEAHYVSFAIGSDGYYAVLRVAGDEETPLVDWQQFPHVRRGQQANRLRVTCAGPTCHFFINDEYATTIEDDTWLTGDVGLWVHSFQDADVAIQFRDVRAWAER